MASFSSKKLSEVYLSLLHGDDGVGNPLGVADTSTNVEMRTGNNVATPINVTTDEVAINQSTQNALIPAGVPLSVASSAGNNGGIIWGGTVDLWNADSSTGGRIRLHDPNASTKVGYDHSFYIGNFKSSDGSPELRIRKDDGTTVKAMATFQVKGGETLCGIGTSNPVAPLSVGGGKIWLENGTVFNKIGKYFYVNANGVNTNNGPIGDDSNPGTASEPFKTIYRALLEISPYGHSEIRLYSGIASSQLTYNICYKAITGCQLRIRTIRADGSTFASGAELIENRDNTFLAQTLANDYTGSTDDYGYATWILYDATLFIRDITINVTYPGDKSAHWKVPFKILHGHGTVKFGWHNSHGVKSVHIDFKNQNTDTGGGDNVSRTGVVNIEEGSGTVITNRTKIINQAGISSRIFNICGGAWGKHMSTVLEYPATGHSPQIGETVDSGTTGSSTTY